MLFFGFYSCESKGVRFSPQGQLQEGGLLKVGIAIETTKWEINKALVIDIDVIVIGPSIAQVKIIKKPKE